MQTNITTAGDAEISCFGELQDDSNFEVVCEHEEDDFMWLLGNTYTDKPFATWQEVADFLQKRSEGFVVEISAI